MEPEDKGQVDSQPDDAGAEDNQDGQLSQTPEPDVSQLSDETEIELPDGGKVKVGELKKGYMKDADYRQKTEEIAREREKIDELRADVRNEFQARRDVSEGELPTPEEIMEGRMQRLEASNAHTFLTGKIDRLTEKFPEADKDVVFDRCWANPNAVIEEEMKRSHTKMEAVKSSVTQFNTDDERDKYDKGVIEKYLANKKQKKSAAGGFATPSGGTEAVKADEKEPAKTIEEAGDRLRASLKAQSED